MITEYYVAPVSMRITWDVKKIQEEWSYQIKMNFHFDHHPDEKIKDMILTEFGVYNFPSQNYARIEGKRTAKQMEDYFRDELPKVITEAIGGL